jgi:hypothetical protein
MAQRLARFHNLVYVLPPWEVVIMKDLAFYACLAAAVDLDRG